MLSSILLREREVEDAAQEIVSLTLEGLAVSRLYAKPRRVRCCFFGSFPCLQLECTR